MSIAIPVGRKPLTRVVRPPMLLVVVYGALLQYAYATVVAPSFAYRGYKYVSPDWALYGVAVVMVLVVTIAMPRRIERPSQMILWIVFLVAAVPSALIPFYAEVISPGEALLTSAWLLFSFLMVVLLVGQKRGALVRFVPRLDLGSHFWLLIAGLSIVCYGYMVLRLGITPKVTSLFDVSDVRMAGREESTTSVALGYLIRLQSNIVNPIIIARGIYSRRWVLVTIGFIGQLYIFSLTGFRTMALAVPTAVLIAIFFKKIRPTGRRLAAGFAGVVVFSVAMDRVFDTIAWSSLFVRRFLITPGQLTANYIDIWSQLPKVKLSNSLLSPIYDYPYQLPPSQFVGQRIGGADGLSANANPFASGYMNFGYGGMLFEMALLTVLLLAIDAACRGLPTPVACIVFALPAIYLTNASVIGSLLTHGSLAGILLCACAPRTGWGRQPRAEDRSRRRPTLSANGRPARLPQRRP